MVMDDPSNLCHGKKGHKAFLNISQHYSLLTTQEAERDSEPAVRPKQQHFLTTTVSTSWVVLHRGGVEAVRTTALSSSALLDTAGVNNIFVRKV